MNKSNKVTYQTERAVMLYAWQPKGHGQYSFFVAATSEEEARIAVEKHMAEDEYIDDYETEGWGTDYYELTILPVGVATSNAND
jgi:hypothetical protein